MSRTNPRVLVADKFDAEGIEGLKAMGCEVHVDADLAQTPLPRRWQQAGPMSSR